MNKLISIPLKYILIFFVSFAVLIWLVFFPSKYIPKTEIVTTKTIEVKKKIDSAIVDYSNKKPTKVLVSVKKVDSKNASVKKDTVLQANQYKDTIQLKNGTVLSTITSTGKVLSLDLKLINYDSIFHTQTTITETKYITKNTWFINYEPKFTMFPKMQILAHEVSIDYTIKDKFRIGVGVGYNAILPDQKFYTGLKIGFKL